jgi:molecular chaperone DnaK (HSP70)
MTASGVDTVLLVGGSTRIPLVSTLLEEITGKHPRKDLHPELCVSLGAGVLASRLAGQDVSRVLVDITPYSFGPSYLGDLPGRPYYLHCYKPIIQRNTPLPASHTELYFTSQDDQDLIEIEIYQGDDPDALNNILVGQFRVEDLTPQPAGSPITCRMDLDVDGILHVTVTEKTTGMQKKVSIEGALQAMSQEQLAASRARLQELLGEDEAFVLEGAKRPASRPARRAQEAGEGGASKAGPDLQRETVRILARAARLRASMNEEDGREADQLIEEIERSQGAGSEKALEAALAGLADLLFYVEER